MLAAESPDGQFESYIRSGKVAAPEGEVSGRTRTDHAFIECRDAAVAALLARLSGVRAQGLASGDRGVRISRPKGYAPPPGGDPFPVAVPVELLDALGVDPDNNPRNADGTTLTAAQMSAVTGQKRGGIPARRLCVSTVRHPRPLRPGLPDDRIGHRWIRTPPTRVWPV